MLPGLMKSFARFWRIAQWAILTCALADFKSGDQGKVQFHTAASDDPRLPFNDSMPAQALRWSDITEWIELF